MTKMQNALVTEALPAYNFVLRVEASIDLPCKSIRGIDYGLAYDYLQEGGLNDYVHILRKPVTEPYTFEVERYILRKPLDPLGLGTVFILPLILYVTQSRNADEEVGFSRAFIFRGCTVIGKSYSEMNAERSELLVETSKIAYQELMVMPIEGGEMKKWAFDGNDIKGNNERSASYNPKEARLKELEEEAAKKRKSF